MIRQPDWLRRLADLALLAVLAGVLTGCGVFSGDDEEDPPAELVKLKNEFKIKKAWSAGIGDGTERLLLSLAPAGDGTNIYAAAHDGRVMAFEAGGGKRLWKVKTKQPLAGGPTVGEGLVIVGSSDGDLIALDAETGTQKWRIDVSSEVLSAPAIDDGRVYLRTVDGKITAFSTGDGEQLWAAQQQVPRLSVRGTSAPVVYGDLVVCGFDNGRVVAYQAEDGAEDWNVLLAPPRGKTEIERLVDVNSTPRVVGGDLYAVGYQTRVVALAPESGQELWGREVSSVKGLAADISNLYISGQYSEMLAMSRGSGREIWRHEYLRNRKTTAPVAFGSSVVVGDFEGYLHFMDPTSGEFQARVRAGRKPITTQPLVMNGLLYVLTDGGKLYAFKDATKRRGD